ncbi:MAG: lipid II flippase MurJ, partial [Anaerolineae bacterium]
LALLPFALEVVVIQFFFARQDTLTPVIADVAAFALNVVLIWRLMPSLGLGGIALAAALAKGAKVLALLWLFGRRVPEFRPAALLPFLGRMALAGLVAGGVLLLGASLGRPWAYDGGLIALALYLAAGAAVGGGVFFLVAHLLGVDETRQVWQPVRRWLRGLAGG